jgi:hypothetical protein
MRGGVQGVEHAAGLQWRASRLGLSGTTYDNSGCWANSWRHVALNAQTHTVHLPMPTFGLPSDERQDSSPSPAVADPIVIPALPAMWKVAGKAAAMMVGVGVTAILGSRKR